MTTPEVNRSTAPETTTAGPSRPYQPPTIRTFSSEQIAAAIGPAQMCSPNACAVGPNG